MERAASPAFCRWRQQAHQLVAQLDELLLPTSTTPALTAADGKGADWSLEKPTAATVKNLKASFGVQFSDYDQAKVLTLEKGDKGGVLKALKVPKAGLRAILTLSAPSTKKDPATVNIVQEENPPGWNPQSLTGHRGRPRLHFYLGEFL